MDKKELIIKSAIDLFQTKGIDKTTVSQIVKEAKIAQGTFYLYFPSKLALMPAIAEEMVKVLVARIEDNLLGATIISEKMERIIDSIFAVNEEYSEILALIYSGLASTEHLKDWERVYAPCYELISDLLEAAEDVGELSLAIDSHRAAKLVIGLVESAAEQVFLYNHRDDQEIVNQKLAVKEFLFSALKIK